MSSFEWNKIIGAVLGTGILAMVAGLIATNLVKPKLLAQPAYVVASAEPSKETQTAAVSEAAGPEPIDTLLAGADAAAGKAVATKKCGVCHTFDKGGAKKIGPNLYDVFGEPVAAERDGFAFSSALTAHKSETWTVDELNHWLFNPQAFAKGSKMVFAGLPDTKERANVVAFLNSLSDKPKPLGK